MTILIEFSRPCLWRPFFFRSTLCRRAGWLFFGIAVYNIRHDQLLARAELGDIFWKD